MQGPHSVFPSTISERRPSAETKATQQCYQLYVVDCQIWLWKQWWTTWLSNISSAACIVSLSFEKKINKVGYNYIKYFIANIDRALHLIEWKRGQEKGQNNVSNTFVISTQ